MEIYFDLEKLDKMPIRNLIEIRNGERFHETTRNNADKLLHIKGHYKYLEKLDKLTMKKRHPNLFAQGLFVRYRVYRNINNGMISIRCTKNNLVVGHAASVDLIDCKYIVFDSGRDRVLKEKRKNVHAFVEGEIVCAHKFKPYRKREIIYTDRVDVDGIGVGLERIQIKYNPYVHDSFVNVVDGTKVTESLCAYVSCSGLVYAYY